MRKFLLLPLLLGTLLISRPVVAQELQAEVTVTTENVTITDRQLITQLQTDIRTFLNNRTWTRQTFRPEERIRCRFFVGITEIPQTGTYKASVRVLSTRPLYGTSYETPFLSFVDRNWVFNYSPQNPLNYSDNTFVSNLSSLLSFYAYLIIGMDQDSFSKLGGTPYYAQAQNILLNATGQTLNPQESDAGWRDTESRNRYWLLNNAQDPQLEAFRTGIYNYYRQGMDIFIQKPDEARASIFSAIQGIQQAVVRRPGTLLARSFFDTKSDEIANVFRTGQDQQQKQQVVSILSDIDPTNISKYQVILR